MNGICERILSNITHYILSDIEVASRKPEKIVGIKYYVWEGFMHAVNNEEVSCKLFNQINLK